MDCSAPVLSAVPAVPPVSADGKHGAEVKSVLPQANPHYQWTNEPNKDLPGASAYAGELTPSEKH